MHPIEPDATGWATWQLLRVELEADLINVDAVELPTDASEPLSLLTLTFDRELVGRDHEALVAMLRRWATGTTLCHVLRTDRPEGGLALFQGAESLVVTSTPQ
jgi:hypothetical protein